MLKVLIVDDSEMLRELFAEYLRFVGFDVVGVVGTVPEAVELTVVRRPDIALVDYHLGKRLGTEILAHVPAPCRPAVLYLSGRPLGQTLTTDDGEGFIQKPVSLVDLASALTAVWARRTTGSTANMALPRGLRWLESHARDESRSA